MKTRRCNKVLKKRLIKGPKTNTNHSLFSNLHVGMKVQIKVIPTPVYNKLKSYQPNIRKLIKNSYYYQANEIIDVTQTHITLRRVFAKTYWKISRKKAWFNLVVDNV